MNPNCEVTGSGLKIWVYAIKDIKKMMSYLMTMDLVTMMIINNSPVNVGRIIVLVILFVKDQAGGLKK